MTDKKALFAEAQMLIRKPVESVFSAFIDPTITVNFWFTKSSAPLEVGNTIIWEWEMYDVSTKVSVKKIIPNKIISIEWGDPATIVDFEFSGLNDESTYVEIKNYGFTETGDNLIRAIKENTAGFTTVLDGAKAYLEHGLQLNLIGDKFPKKVSRSA